MRNPKEEPNMISDWLEQNRNPEIDRQVENEAEELCKQETIEEAAERWNEKQTKLEFGKPHNAPNRIKAFIQGAKWQAERMHSDMQEYAEFCIECDRKEMPLLLVKDWFEQFKKK